MEPTTIAKGAGGGLLIGGGGTGAYFAGREYFSSRLENLDAKQYIKETEKYEKTVEFIDTLEDTDEYVEKLGRAYYHYREIYVGETSDEVKDVSDSLSGGVQSDTELKLGKRLLQWCKDEVKKDKDKQDRKKVQHWCIKRSTNAEKVKKEDDKKIPRGVSTDFEVSDYSSIKDRLNELNILFESSWMGNPSDENSKKNAALRWCQSKVHVFYYEDSKDHYNLIKNHCFKDKS